MRFFKEKKLYAFFLTCMIPLSAQVYFNGYTGAGLIASPKNSSFTPQVQLQAYFSGQFQLSKDFLLRTNFSGFTGNIFETKISGFTAGYFYIDGISLSYHHSIWKGFNNYVSVFYNEEDAIGSDLFLRRYFGVNQIASYLTTSLQGNAPLKIYAMEGLGLSYTVRFPKPTALALYAYYNSPNNGIGFNSDIRFAAKWDYFILDAAFGFAAAGDNKDANGNKVILIINNITLRSAITMLIGETHSTNLFVQAGIYRGIVYPASSAKITLNDIFLLFEPRLRIAQGFLNTTFYIMPKETVSRFIYTNDPIGISVAYIWDSFFKQNISFGVNVMVSGESIENSPYIQKLNFSFAPFVDVETGAGKFSTALRISPLQFINDATKSIMFMLQYRTQL